ncbi:MAG: hypothetical protein CVV59_01665 [Tenericutes bacterium HGW-Tenericutes-4]|nr:MAG: hypothetical protein CVV59_01665 [Tenericutes bacterium HGW-Tenericutes-4]
MILKIEFNYEFENNVARPSKDATLEEANSALREQRKRVSEFYSQKNQEMIALFDLPNETYISKYAPIVFLDGNKAFNESLYNKINQISKSDKVKNIYIQNNKQNEIQTSFFDSTTIMNIQDYIVNGFYDGTGATIGILDAGILDKNHVNFANRSDIIVRNEWWFFETVSDHANKVTSIAGVNTGVARGAKILSVQLSGEPSGEVEWMLDRDVNVINNSWRTSVSDGVYNSTSAYFDYIVKNTWVTVVSAVGNEGEVTGQEYVGNPALGYNVVSVGSVSNSMNVSTFSSFKETSSISKPTLTAIGQNLTIPSYLLDIWGTSFAAPMVTGSIAILMQMFPSLKTHPEKVITLLTASATPMSGYTNYNTSGLEDKVGAGCLDLEKAHDIYWGGIEFSISSASPNSVVQQVYLSFSQPKNLRASLTWLIDCNKSTNVSFSNYNLRLVDSNGIVIKSVSSTYNNLEFLDYDITSSGLYTLEVYLSGSKVGSSNDICSISIN